MRRQNGMALVNLGDADAEVVAVALDGNGIELGRVLISDSLAPNTKVLAVLNDLFQENPDQRIEIHSSQNAVIMFLRGSAVEGPSYLYQTQAIVVE